jgi:hypothetical protein
MHATTCHEEMAEKLAGEMKQQGRLYVFLPIDETERTQ